MILFRKQRRSSQDSRLAMNTGLVLPEIRLIDDIDRKRPSSAVLPIPLYFLSHEYAPRLQLHLPLKFHGRLSAEQFVEGDEGVREVLPGRSVISALLFP